MHAIGGDIHTALETVSVPAYLIDLTGVIRWVNPAAQRIVGDARGRQLTSVVAPEETRRAREAFARKIAGTEKVTDAPVVLVDPAGRRTSVEISSVPLVEGHRIVGVFGQIGASRRSRPNRSRLILPRPAEILRLLQHGRSTHQIATELHLSIETIASHPQPLRALDVHSRLEAVAVSRTEGFFSSD